MTRDEALQAVEEIRSIKTNTKMANDRKKDLYWTFIAAVANARYSSIRDARMVADAVLEAENA